MVCKAELRQINKESSDHIPPGTLFYNWSENGFSLHYKIGNRIRFKGLEIEQTLLHPIKKH